jgi:hypothetical protein
MEHRFPSPPDMDEQRVRDLVEYARSVIAYLAQEKRLAHDDGARRELRP